MARTSLPSSEGSNRTRKRTGRRARGLEITERDGSWHVAGTIRAGGRSIRVRRSLGLSATAQNYDTAWEELRKIESDIRAEATGGKTRGDPVGIAARAYLTRPRERPLGPATIRIVKDLVAKFGPKRLNEISEKDWRSWVDQRQAGNTSRTRERYLNSVCAFLSFARAYHGLAVPISFDRDKEARNPRRRKRRRVEELRADLLALLFSCCHISLRAQLVTQWSTGARVSSILYGVLVCDVILAPKRGKITFRATKNGDDVVATLHPSAVAVLREYAEWRGSLHDREQPFFLTHRRRPYADNGRAGGGQNKSAFGAAKRRARAQLFKAACDASKVARKAGKRAAALDLLMQARVDMKLLRRVTQHWFRHLVATRMRGDLRSAMDQGGWRDERSVLGYVADVQETRRAIVDGFEDFVRFQTRDPEEKDVTA